MGSSKNYGYLVEGPYSNDCKFGVYVGVPVFWETTICRL